MKRWFNNFSEINRWSYTSKIIICENVCQWIVVLSENSTVVCSNFVRDMRLRTYCPIQLKFIEPILPSLWLMRSTDIFWLNGNRMAGIFKPNSQQNYVILGEFLGQNENDKRALKSRFSRFYSLERLERYVCFNSPSIWSFATRIKRRRKKKSL